MAPQPLSSDQAPEVPVVVALPVVAGLLLGGSMYVTRRRRGAKGTAVARA